MIEELTNTVHQNKINATTMNEAATDMNRIMLYSRLKFKPQSKLRKYLSRKTGIKKSCYFLAEIAHELKIIIKSEGLYDPPPSF